MNSSQAIETLRKFKDVDKYIAFVEILPGIEHTPPDKKKILDHILNSCCNELIKALEKPKKTKTALKEIIFGHLDFIRDSKELDAPNRDFGYELCWYLSEKAGLNLKRSSDTKVWGYWKVNANEVKTVSVIRKKSKPKEK